MDLVQTTLINETNNSMVIITTQKAIIGETRKQHRGKQRQNNSVT